MADDNTCDLEGCNEPMLYLIGVKRLDKPDDTMHIELCKKHGEKALKMIYYSPMISLKLTLDDDTVIEI